jgi:hypothetical protein
LTSCARIGSRQANSAIHTLHLATFAIARREIEELEFLTADRRLQAAAEAV